MVVILFKFLFLPHALKADVRMMHAKIWSCDRQEVNLTRRRTLHRPFVEILPLFCLVSYLFTWLYIEAATESRRASA